MVARGLLALTLLAGGAGVASGQEPVAPAPPASAGPLVLEPMHNGFILAPEVKITRVDRKAAALAGAYGGWVKDDHLLIGGGGYWLADRKRDGRRLGYGGAVLGWFFNPEQKVSVSAKALLGFGRTSETVDVEIPYCLLPEKYLCGVSLPPMPGVTVHGMGRPVTLPPRPGSLVHNVDRYYDDRVRYRTTFFVAEPEIDVVARLGARLRLTAGASYRATGSRYHRTHASGPSGTVAVQFRF